MGGRSTTVPLRRSEAELADRDAARRQFLEAMAAAPAAVTVVATSGPAGSYAMTVSSMASVSADPPSLLVCLKRRSPLCRALPVNGFFSVSILAADQTDLADTFAGRIVPGTAPYDMAAAEWNAGPYDIPALAAAAASFECELTRTLLVDSHAVFFGQVIRSRRPARRCPVVHWERSYHALTDDPDLRLMKG